MDQVVIQEEWAHIISGDPSWEVGECIRSQKAQAKQRAWGPSLGAEGSGQVQGRAALGALSFQPGGLGGPDGLSKAHKPSPCVGL